MKDHGLLGEWNQQRARFKQIHLFSPSFCSMIPFGQSAVNEEKKKKCWEVTTAPRRFWSKFLLEWPCSCDLQSELFSLQCPIQASISPQFITSPWRMLTQVRKVALKRDPLSLSASLPSAARGRTAETRLPNGQCQFFPSPCVPGTSPIKKGSLRV